VIAALAAATLVLACEPPFEPLVQQERRVLVHAILDPSADSQFVMLEWTQASDFQVGIVGATVGITSPQGQTANATMRPNAAPAPGAPARYVFLLSETFLTVQAGGTYQLSIAIAGQPTITGTTTVPNAIPTTTITTRTLPFLRLRDTLRMNLPRVPGAAGYRMLSSARHAAQPNFFFPVVSVFTDTAVVLPGTLETVESEEQFFPAQMTVDIVALAVDDNYFTYFTTATDPFAGAPPTRLTGGAVGLFGSVVPLRRHRFPVQ
jgi:hypothetical protein